ncbi:hypothetical protein F5Y13DRAFT_176409 [Hypoxylon sp. FL1857]|nr:hypothetical protein F5Y13DRAFT_176409 [Hypoxylon sp. FL1857]
MIFYQVYRIILIVSIPLFAFSFVDSARQLSYAASRLGGVRKAFSLILTGFMVGPIAIACIRQGHFEVNIQAFLFRFSTAMRLQDYRITDLESRITFLIYKYFSCHKTCNIRYTFF